MLKTIIINKLYSLFTINIFLPFQKNLKYKIQIFENTPNG